LIILHLGITLFLAYSLNLWLDEAYTLHTTGKGLAHAFYQASHFELQPPLYFVLLSLWRKFNSAIFFARLPSVLCIALTIKVVADLSKRFLKEVNSAWVIACVASSPFMIWAAVEMRVYAFVILLSGLLLRFFFDGFLEESPRSSSRWWYVLVSILALYTQYYLGFLLVANACALLLLRRWRSLAVYLAGMGIVAICFAPMVNIVLYQLSTHVPRNSATLSVLDSAGSVYWIVQEYLLPVGWVQFHFLRRWLLRFGSVALLVLIMTKYRQRITADRIAIWTIAVALTLCLIGVQRLTAEGLVAERHAATLFLPITLAAFSFVSAIGQRKLVLGWVFLVLVFNATTLYTSYAAVAKSGDWIRVAAHISSYEKPGQPVLVFQAASVLSLAQYYDGENLLVPIPNETGLETYPVPASRPLDEKQIAEAVKHVSESPEVWLVTDWTRGFSGDEIDDPILKEFVRRNYTVEKETTFYYSKVFLLRLKPLSRKTSPS
jgi:uncharacterized membrane protein